MFFNEDEQELLRDIEDSGLSEHLYFKQQARDSVVDNDLEGIKYVGVATVLGGFVLFGLMGPIGAIAAATVGGQLAYNKIRKGRRELAQIRNTDDAYYRHLKDPQRLTVRKKFPEIVPSSTPEMRGNPPKSQPMASAPSSPAAIDQEQKEEQGFSKHPNAVIREFENRLHADSAEKMLMLLSATPIRLVGEQRSGKTTMAKVIGLMRQLYDTQHVVEACTPHKELESPWPRSFNLYGIPARFDEIEDRMDQLCRWIKQGNKAKATQIYDEFASYRIGFENCGSSQESIQELMTQALTAAAKHNKFLIFILHGETKAMYGNVDGISEMMRTQTTSVFCRSKKDKYGTASPGDTIEFQQPGGQRIDIKRPSWLTPQHLEELLQKVAKEAPAKVYTRYSLSFEDAVKALDRLESEGKSKEYILNFLWEGNDSGELLELQKLSGKA